MVAGQFVKRRVIPRDPSEHITLPAGVTPALVEEQTWALANQKLRGNGAAFTRNAGIFYLLRGMVRCGRCGLTMPATTTTSAGRRYRYYRCASSVRPETRTCDQALVNADDLEALVWASIEDALRHPEMIERQVAEDSAERRDGHDRLRREADTLRGRLAEIDTKKANAVIALSDAPQHAAALRAALDTLDSERDGIAASLKAVEAEQRHVAAALIPSDVWEYLARYSDASGVEYLDDDGLIGTTFDPRAWTPEQRRERLVVMGAAVTIDGKAWEVRTDFGRLYDYGRLPGGESVCITRTVR